jgi:DNA-binding winged helix-turn-helix (wHTH) protein
LDTDRYQLGQVTVDIGARQVRRGTLGIKLPGYPWKLVVYLLQRYPEPVGLREIYDHIWPGDKSSDELMRGKLNSTAAEVRKKLSSDGTKMITIGKEFASFAVEVTPLESSDQIARRQPKSPAADKFRLRERPFTSAMLILGLLCLIAAVTMAIVSSEPPRNHTLVVGLAKFSPDTQTAIELRSRIKMALEEPQYEGPRVEVQLLDGELNGSKSTVSKQAKLLSRDRVNTVIGATALGNDIFVPQSVVVRQFGVLLPGEPILWDRLKIRFNREDKTYGDTAAPIADLIKILYGGQFIARNQLAKAEKIFRSLHDQNLGLVIAAQSLLISTDAVSTEEEALNRLHRAKNILDELVRFKAGECVNPVDSENSLCLGYAIRAIVSLRLFQRTDFAKVSNDDLDFVREDLDLSTAYFRSPQDQDVIAELTFARARFFTLTAGVRGVSGGDVEASFLEAKRVLDGILNHNSLYDSLSAERKAVTEGELALVLFNLEQLQNRRELIEPARVLIQSVLQGCSEEVPPSQSKPWAPPSMGNYFGATSFRVPRQRSRLGSN